MSKIVISRKEYDDLLENKMRFDYLKQIFHGNIFSQPPVKNIAHIIKAFGQTKKYNAKFLKSLETGLQRSNYFSK